MTTDKLQPFNEEAESAVLGSILIDPEMIKVISLLPEDFYDERNSTIYNVMLKLKTEGKGVNQITIAQMLDEQGKLEEVGGAGYFSHLVAETPTSLDCQHYADIVQNLSSSRRLIVAGKTIEEMGYSANGDTTANIAKADKLLLDLRKTAGGSHIITPEERDKILAERYTTLYSKQQGIAIGTGLIDLDRRLGGGLFPGDMIVLGARPGVGKTTMLECIANHIGRDSNVLFCSAEMNMESLSDRDVANQLGVPIEVIRYGNYEDDVITQIIDKALPWISGQKIYHLDFTRSYQITTANIYQSAYEIKERYGLAMVVVDYLSLLTDKYGNNNNERVGYITRTLKEMSMTLEIPLLVAHQLNRASEMRPDKRPQLQDLRDSGNVEQDADIVLFLYRDSYYKKDSDSNITEIIIAKQRQGQSGIKVRVVWDEKHQTYRNLAKEKQ